MPLPRTKPLRWAPSGLSDAVDGTEAFDGAMSRLDNLVPDPSSARTWLARAAAVAVANLPDFAGGPVTIMQSFGRVVYGMYASTAFSGKDRPFAYDLVAGTFAAITGLASTNLPASQATSGDWTPPTVAQIGSRIVFTHPGFPDGVFSETFYNNFLGNTHSNTTVDGYFPQVTAFTNGTRISGTNIPDNTTVAGTGTLSTNTTATGSAGAFTFTVASGTGLVYGELITGVGFPAGSFVTQISGGTTILMNNVLTQNISGSAVNFSGHTITLSQAATGSANQETLTASRDGSVGRKFGWLDVSAASFTLTGQLTNLSATVGVPSIAGVQVGQGVSGGGISAGTFVDQIFDPTVFNAPGTTLPSSTSTSYLLVTIAVGGQAPQAGQIVAGPGIQTGTIVSAAPTINSSTLTTIDYLVPLTLIPTAASGNYSLTGSYAVLLNKVATFNGASTLTFTGGSAAAPLWGAGDTAFNPLASIPVFVAQFNGRAFFGVNTTGPVTSGVTASDVGLPCQVSNTQQNQTLLFQDGIPVTAAAGLALFNQLGGIVQSLMVFQGDANIRQITGDFLLNNVVVNSLQTATGTLAPNTIAQTPLGVIFLASDGLRMIDFDARVSNPIAIRGKGLAVPFINIVTPSRANATFNENVYRLTVTWQPPARLANIWGSAQRTDEFWLHLDLQKWSGPHSTTLDQGAVWQNLSSFIVAPTWGRGTLYRSDPVPQQNSIYVENGAPLNWTFATVLLPDNPEQMAILVVESSLFYAMANNTQALVEALDDIGNVLDETYISLGPQTAGAQRPIPWHNPVIARQMMVTMTGQSGPLTLLGGLNLRYQVLEYQIPRPALEEFILGSSILGGPDVLGP